MPGDETVLVTGTGGSGPAGTPAQVRKFPSGRRQYQHALKSCLHRSHSGMAIYPYFQEAPDPVRAGGEVLPVRDPNVSWHCMHDTLKRFSVYHASGSRSIVWGSVTTDMIAMVEQKLPLRAFLFCDEQSDKEALQRMNARFCPPGATSLVPHLLLGRGFALHATLAGDDAPASLGCIMRSLPIASCCSECTMPGCCIEQWEKYFPPRATIKVSLQMMAHVVLLARCGAKVLRSGWQGLHFSTRRGDTVAAFL